MFNVKSPVIKNCLNVAVRFPVVCWSSRNKGWRDTVRNLLYKETTIYSILRYCSVAILYIFKMHLTRQIKRFYNTWTCMRNWHLSTNQLLKLILII